MKDLTSASRDTIISGSDRQVKWCVQCSLQPASRHRCRQFEAGTMFELVQALNDGAEELKRRSPNPISLNAGCELFIAFVTLFPHESDVSVLFGPRVTLPADSWRTTGRTLRS